MGYSVETRKKAAVEPSTELVQIYVPSPGGENDFTFVQRLVPVRSYRRSMLHQDAPMPCVTVSTMLVPSLEMEAGLAGPNGISSLEK